MLIESAKSIIESNKINANKLVNYSFNKKWIIETTNTLNIFSKTDENFPYVTLIVADSIGKSQVFLGFNEYYEDMNNDNLPIKKNFIYQTNKEEREYLKTVFYKKNNKIKFDARKGQYELFYPYFKNGKIIVIHFSDYQRYGKLGS